MKDISNNQGWTEKTLGYLLFSALHTLFCVLIGSVLLIVAGVISVGIRKEVFDINIWFPRILYALHFILPLKLIEWDRFFSYIKNSMILLKNAYFGESKKFLDLVRLIDLAMILGFVICSLFIVFVVFILIAADVSSSTFFLKKSKPTNLLLGT
ncbi:MAG: hypothetical protein AABX70_02675 [Nanoarchaeota archaeon]